ncbi:hypothetical protein BpHYR1_049801 [Brachionus plicatilis]|uniref:Uncharacterized protein n=1 Tax=Brachionus plicatilis TaxID=10195 RepID=A0A3M7RL08_BRAPC|nr:hypothetical protein BpHYR1_049801 [Brachionus plicatilis]
MRLLSSSKQDRTSNFPLVYSSHTFLFFFKTLSIYSTDSLSTWSESVAVNSFSFSPRKFSDFNFSNGVRDGQKSNVTKLMNKTLQF